MPSPRRCLIFNFQAVKTGVKPDVIIIPAPQELNELGETVSVEGMFAFQIENAGDPEFFKEFLREELRPYDLDLTFEEKFPFDIVDLPFDPRCSNAEESYRLHVGGDFAKIDALTDKGLYYGLLTFFQLLHKSGIKQVLLPQLDVFDYPTMKIRGMSDDISRGQVFTVDAAKRYIREISRVKNNFFAIYFEDTFEFSAHPKIGLGRGRLTASEVGEICKYGARFFVEVFPIFESYQHWDNILRIPEYEKFGEFPGSFNLNIGEPAIYPLIDGMYADLAKAFPSSYFHIGGDEAFDIGRYRSREYVAQAGGLGPALGQVLTKLVEMAKAHGKTKILMYQDIVIHYEDALAALPKDLILMYWNYSGKKKNKHTKIKKLRDAGFDVIVSPAMINWGRNWPDIHKSWNNITNIIKAGVKFNALGVLNSTWGDNGNEDMHENRYWGAYLSGAMAWNLRGFEKDRFWEGYARLFYGIKGGPLVKAIYQTLSTFNEQWMLVYPVRFMPMFWCHPFPASEIKPYYKDWVKLQAAMEQAEQLITQLEEEITRNKWHVDYLKLAAMMGKTLARKYATSMEIASIISAEGVNPVTVAMVEKECQEMIMLYGTTRDLYEKLWLQCAKRDMLDRVLLKFDWMIKVYEKKIAEIKAGIKWINPFLPSEWIYARGARGDIDHSYFVRSVVKLNIPKDFIKRAHVQLVGNDYATLFVNGRKVGSVSSRFCLSPVPRDTAVKIFDIQKFLEPGENAIGIEGQCFSVAMPAVLAYGEIVFKDGRMYPLVTDKNWKGNTSLFEGWALPTFGDASWEPIKSRGQVPAFNSEINLPDLDQGIPSRVTDHFGELSFMSVAAAAIVGSALAKLVKNVLGIGMKLMGLRSYLL